MQVQLVTLLDRGERAPRAAASAARGRSPGHSFAWLLSAEAEPSHALRHLSLPSPWVSHRQTVSSSQVAPNEAQAEADAQATSREKPPPTSAWGPARGSCAFSQPCYSFGSLVLALVPNGGGGMLLFCSKSYSTCKSCYGTSDVSQIPIPKSWPHTSTRALLRKQRCCSSN